jgi:single-stranded DNA-binding protein
MVSIHGTLRTSLFDNKNGEKSISIDLFADRVDFVSVGSGSTQSNDATTDTGTFKPKTQEAEVAAASAASTDDDLPF